MNKNILGIAIIVAAVGGAVLYFNSTRELVETGSEFIDEKSEGAEMMTQNETVAGEDMKEAARGQMAVRYIGDTLAGVSSPLLDFAQADYETALRSDKLVALYFYADWCPICKKEIEEALYPAFNELVHDRVVGFRVNYNDTQTDGYERDLAKEFGIAYQHSKVFLKHGEQILKSLESWNKTRYLTEIANAI